MKTVSPYIQIAIILAVITKGSGHAQEAGWKNISAPLGHIQAVTSTDNGQTILLVTSLGILRSQDQGRTWAKSDSGIVGQSVSNLFNGGPFLLASARRGVYRSVDEGHYWLKTSLPDSFFSMISQALDGTLYVKGSPTDLYSSHDLGLSWETLSFGSTDFEVQRFKNAWSIVIEKSGHVLFSYDSCSFLHSLDGGYSWERKIVPSVRGFAPLRMQTSGKFIFAATDSSGFFRSSDDGMTWERSDSLGVHLGYPNVLPDGTIILPVWDKDLSWISNDNGGTWKHAPPQQSIRQYHRVAGDTLLAIGKVYYEGNTLLRSTTNGNSWSRIATSFGEANIMKTGPRGDLYAATEWAGAYRTTDRGESWEPISELTTINAMVFTSSATAINSSLDGVYVSTDNCMTWKNAAEHGLGDSTTVSLVATPKGTLLAGAYSKIIEIKLPSGGITIAHTGGGLWRSSDSGDSWHKILIDSSYKTTNGGTTWFEQRRNSNTVILERGQPDFSVNAISVWGGGEIRVDKKTGYREAVYSSTDDGISWTEIEQLEYGEKSRTKLVTTPKGEIFSGTARSTDGGRSFNEVRNGLTSEGGSEVQALPNGDLLLPTETGLFYLPHRGNTWLCVGWKGEQVTSVAFNDGFVFVSMQYDMREKRNGVYRANLETIRARLPKRLNEPEVWTEINGPHLKNLRTFIVDGTGNLWVGDDHEHLSVSTNKGKQWTEGRMPDYFVHSFAVHPSGTYVLAGTYKGLLKSTNHGTSWETISALKGNDQDSGPNVEAIHFAQDGTTFVATSEDGPFRNPCLDSSKKVLSYIAFGGSSTGRIYKKGRGASEWIPLDASFGNSVNDILSNKRGMLFATVRGEGLFVSEDKGSTWKPCNKGLLTEGALYTCNIGADIDRSLRCAAFDSHGSMIVARGWGNLYRTTNNGTSWTPLTPVGGIVSALYSDPHDTLYAGAEHGAFRSADGGKTWMPFSAGLTSTSVISLGVHPDGFLYAATRDGRLFRSKRQIASIKKING
jgi:photosystem II stability/assembly factor-like uncharacterized protein